MIFVNSVYFFLFYWSIFNKKTFSTRKRLKKMKITTIITTIKQRIEGEYIGNVSIKECDVSIIYKKSYMFFYEEEDL